MTPTQQHAANVRKFGRVRAEQMRVKQHRFTLDRYFMDKLNAGVARICGGPTGLAARCAKSVDSRTTA